MPNFNTDVQHLKQLNPSPIIVIQYRSIVNIRSTCTFQYYWQTVYHIISQNKKQESLIFWHLMPLMYVKLACVL